jgi:hypothetical protein
MLPYQQFTIITDLTPDQVHKRLMEVVEPPNNRWPRSQKPNKPYQGQIGEHSFKVHRVISSRNSFLPMIQGRIQAQDGGGSQIQIKMSPSLFVVVFMWIWLSSVGQGALLFLAAMFAENFDPIFLVPVGMFLFGIALPLVGFVPEAKRSKKFFIELFQDPKKVQPPEI